MCCPGVAHGLAWRRESPGWRGALSSRGRATPPPGLSGLSVKQGLLLSPLPCCGAGSRLLPAQPPAVPVPTSWGMGLAGLLSDSRTPFPAGLALGHKPPALEISTALLPVQAGWLPLPLLHFEAGQRGLPGGSRCGRQTPCFQGGGEAAALPPGSWHRRVLETLPAPPTSPRAWSPARPPQAGLAFAPASASKGASLPRRGG